MSLLSLLKRSKAVVLERWCELIIQSYPAHTSSFLKREKDRFQNPVGYTVTRETEELYDALLDGSFDEVGSEALEGIIKIRSVQDFSPSQAIGFVFLLKRAIRERLTPEIQQYDLYGQLHDFESVIDRLALCTFDNYMHCREKIFDIRVKEIKNETFRLRELLNYPGKDIKSGPGPSVNNDRS